MVAKNDITGDAIRTKGTSSLYESNFDNIFRKRKDTVASPEPSTNQPLQHPDTDWNEARIDIVGRNGNDGLHYKPND